MEFKQIFQIIWERKNIFLFFLISIIFLALVWFFSQPRLYGVEFSIDISRENYQQTDDYRYDQFYRLQADEKFADTIVQWFSDADFRGRISENYQENDFNMGNLRAIRLSSGYLKVFFETKTEQKISPLMAAVEKALNEKIDQTGKGDPVWFSVIVNDSTHYLKVPDLKLVLLGAFLIGSVLGFFGAIFHYYWQKNESWN